MLGPDAVCAVKLTSITMDTIRSSEFHMNTFIPSRLTVSYDVIFSSGDVITISGLLNKALSEGTFVSQLDNRGGYVISRVTGNFQTSSSTGEPAPSPVMAVTVIDNGSGNIPTGNEIVNLH